MVKVLSIMCFFVSRVVVSAELVLLESSLTQLSDQKSDFSVDFSELAQIKRTDEESYKKFLAKLTELLRSFPEDQRIYFSQDLHGKKAVLDERGKRASDVIWHAVKAVGDYFDLALISFFDKHISPEEVFRRRINMVSLRVPRARQTPQEKFLLGIKRANWLSQEEGDLQMDFKEYGRSLSEEAKKMLSYESAVDKNILNENDVIRLGELAKCYKIHLMPQKDEIPLVLFILICELMKRTELYNNMFDFKFCIPCPPVGKEDPVPTIILYPLLNKLSAQTVLNIVYKLFKDTGIKGTGVVPRYNQKVTDLLYWAQGNGGEKNENKYKNYFDKSLICYRPDFTGEYVDYYLKDPSKLQ